MLHAPSKCFRRRDFWSIRLLTCSEEDTGSVPAGITRATIWDSFGAKETPDASESPTPTDNRDGENVTSAIIAKAERNRRRKIEKNAFRRFTAAVVACHHLSLYVNIPGNIRRRALIKSYACVFGTEGGSCTYTRWSFGQKNILLITTRLFLIIVVTKKSQLTSKQRTVGGYYIFTDTKDIFQVHFRYPIVLRKNRLSLKT